MKIYYQIYESTNLILNMKNDIEIFNMTQLKKRFFNINISYWSFKSAKNGKSSIDNFGH